MSRFVKMPPNFLQEFLSLPKKELHDLLNRITSVLKQSEGEDLVRAIRMGLLTADEYALEYRGKYMNPDGGSSFIQYLLALMAEAEEENKDEPEAQCFVTNNQQMIQDAEKLEKRFGMKVMGVKEFMEKNKDG